MKLKKISAILIIVAALFGTFGCVKNAKDYPLTLGEGGGEITMEGKAGDIYAVGASYFVNESDKNVTITEISLIDTVDMKIAESVLFDVGESKGLIGTAHWPPEMLPIYWTTKEDAIEAQIKPGEARHLVVVLISLTDDVASSEGFHIVYIDATGRKYQQDIDVRCRITDD